MHLLVATLSLVLASYLGPVAPTAAAYAVVADAAVGMPAPAAVDAAQFTKRAADDNDDDVVESVVVKRDAAAVAAAAADNNDDHADEADDDVDGTEPDISSLQPRATRHCSNTGKLTKAVGKCNPSNSKGFKSAHNCKNRGGKRYYCVQGGKGTCYTNLKKLTLENGECFA